MQINKISSLNHFTGVKNNSTNKTESINIDHHSTAGTLAAGMGALAAAGIVAVRMAKEKKIPVEINIDDFSKIGSFKNGFAAIGKKPFSGVINVTNTSGDYALEYLDGVLRTSTKWLGGHPCFKKVYSENDGIKTIERFVYNQAGISTDGLNRPKWLSKGERLLIGDGRIEKYSGVPFESVIFEKQNNGVWQKKSCGLADKRLVQLTDKYCRADIVETSDAGEILNVRKQYLKYKDLTPKPFESKTVVKSKK